MRPALWRQVPSGLAAFSNVNQMPVGWCRGFHSPSTMHSKTLAVCVQAEKQVSACTLIMPYAHLPFFIPLFVLLLVWVFFSSPNFLITSLSPHSLVFRPEFNHQTWQFAPVDTTCARAGALTFTVLWTEDTEEVTSGYLALGWRSKLGQREKKAKKGQNWKFYNLSHMKWPIYSKIMWVCS